MTYFPVPEAGGPPEASARSAEVGTVLAAVPEFLGRYLELVELCDDDPGANEAFCELAEFVAELADGLEQFRPLLTRCLGAVEQVATTSDDAEELVGWSFLDYLSLDVRRAVLPWLGPNTLAVLEAIEEPIGGQPRALPRRR
jgi:hypothetical protein